MAAAKQLFSEKGFAATTAAIAEKAHTTEKTLFKHFPDKNTLLVHVCIETVIENLNGLYLGQFLKNYPLREALINFFSGKINTCLAIGDSFKLFLQAILMDKNLREAFMTSVEKALMTQNNDSMETVTSQLENKQFDPMIFNIFLYSILIGYSVLRSILMPEWRTDDSKNIELIVDAILNGFSGKK